MHTHTHNLFRNLTLNYFDFGKFLLNAKTRQVNLEKCQLNVNVVVTITPKKQNTLNSHTYLSMYVYGQQRGWLSDIEYKCKLTLEATTI